MNVKKETYDRLTVGERIYQRRTQLGYSQLELACMIDRSVKYYGDIERGSCGMSIETLIALSDCLDMTLDEVIFGPEPKEKDTSHSEMIDAVISHLGKLDSRKQDYALRILTYYIKACNLKH